MNAGNDVYQALARAVAEKKIPDDVVQKIAGQIAGVEHPIRRIDVCAYGICIDYFVTVDELWKVLPNLITIPDARLHGIEIFPWGIINPDLFQVHVEHEFAGMPHV